MPSVSPQTRVGVRGARRGGGSAARSGAPGGVESWLLLGARAVGALHPGGAPRLLRRLTRPDPAPQPQHGAHPPSVVVAVAWHGARPGVGAGRPRGASATQWRVEHVTLRPVWPDDLWRTFMAPRGPIWGARQTRPPDGRPHVPAGQGGRAAEPSPLLHDARVRQPRPARCRPTRPGRGRRRWSCARNLARRTDGPSIGTHRQRQCDLFHKFRPPKVGGRPTAGEPFDGRR
jgi:hypothetical protein